MHRRAGRLVTKLDVSVEPSKTPPETHRLLQTFSPGSRCVSFNEDPPRADRAVVACHYDIVTTDQWIKRRPFRKFVSAYLIPEFT